MTPGCSTGGDPADDLSNQELRPLVEEREPQDREVAVELFNALEARRGDFGCARELEALQRAIWREAPGPITSEETDEARAYGRCLNDFVEAAEIPRRPLLEEVLNDWVEQRFAAEPLERFKAEVDGEQERLAKAGCRGEACEGLTIIDGDLVAPRAGLEATLAWTAARERCSRLDVVGLSPWRLPSKAELIAMRKSGELASDREPASYWSADREFDDRGGVEAWALRFDHALRERRDLQPKLVPLRFGSRGQEAKVRCVHDLDGEAPARAPTAVDEMEEAVVASGCDRGRWMEQVRLRQGLLVTWKALGDTKARVRKACGAIGWCGVAWRLPRKGQVEKLAEDPWLDEERAEESCVATPRSKR